MWMNLSKKPDQKLIMSMIYPALNNNFRYAAGTVVCHAILKFRLVRWTKAKHFASHTAK
jgi:hypothetical protein